MTLKYFVCVWGGGGGTFSSTVLWIVIKRYGLGDEVQQETENLRPVLSTGF